MSYAPPAWSALPPAGSYSLEIVRGGVVLERMEINSRPFYLLGRDPAAAQLVLPHPSVSRVHAVVQHSAEGHVFLMDLGSTHGTYIGKKACPANTYVRLPVGATVRLGAGSRTVCLMGPAGEDEEDEAQRTTLVAEAAGASGGVDTTQRLDARARRIAATTGRSTVSAEDLHAGGAGWGFGEDAAAVPAERTDELDAMGLDELLVLLRKSELRLSVRQQRLIEQIEKRSEKLANLATETARISAKEAEGLSDGQAAALKRNEERSKALEEQLESLREQLADGIREQLGAVRNVIEGPAGRRRGKHGEGDDDGHDDEFFDRTARRTKRSGETDEGREEVLSEANIMLKLDALEAEEEELQRQLGAAEIEQRAHRAAASATEAPDALDAYMHSNALDVAQRTIERLTASQQTIVRERDRLRSLLQFVQPALRPEALVSEATAPPPPSASSPMAPPPAKRIIKPAAMDEGTADGRMGGPASGASGVDHESHAPTSAKVTPEGQTGLDAPMSADPSSKRRKLGPSMPPPSASAGVSAAEGAGGDTAGTGRRAMADTFRNEFAAAVERLSRGETAPAANANELKARALSSGAAGAQALEEVAAPGFVGLGFGAARPDEAALRSAREASLQEKRTRMSEASMAAGLNQMHSGHVADAATLVGNRSPHGPIGPLRPPALGASDTADWRTTGGGEADAELSDWMPPPDQDGSGKTALNARLGY